ncbi:MAG: cytoplasmic protein [Kiritimatiellae bacterium]|jgi:hypothetical protein|nr:cytoplasmic protein [Kiritimatiellia bacterium]NLD89433.1 cytoplasmic protein [Lentisphaerota bacterium]HPC20106.1 cytoplasmic protein [Kiritimatiellia bacterium]HQQ61280.1 cytoplasmic protein [Kiritimatiellia bacterium]
MAKYALFAFTGEAGCFIHVLLNALDMQARGHEAKIVVEGAATKLVPGLYEEGKPLNPLWKKCLAADLVDGVCMACAAKMGTLEATAKHELKLLDEMSGHPSIAVYRAAGWEVITF